MPLLDVRQRPTATRHTRVRMWRRGGETRSDKSAGLVGEAANFRWH